MINIKRLFFVLLFFACFFTSEDINAQKINQFNKNKKRTGVWKKYHSNKRIRYIGEFKNGKEIGVFKFYDITSSKNPVITVLLWSFKLLLTKNINIGLMRSNDSSLPQKRQSRPSY